MRIRILLLLIPAAVLTGMIGATLRGADEPAVTAVYSHTTNGYQRAKLPDGTFPLETYLVAKGGYMSGVRQDDSIDDIKFSGLVRALARYLAPQNYYPARVGKNAKLMLVVYWGTTTPFNDSVYRTSVDQAVDAISAATPHDGSLSGAAARNGGNAGQPSAGQQALADEAESALLQLNLANLARTQADELNANLLGYKKEIDYYDTVTKQFAGGDHYYDLVSDVEEERYFVIIGAYDFQEMLAHQKKKLLWKTKVSIRTRGNRFDERLFAMLANASKYFGQDSGGLQRSDERSPRVDLGELKILGVVEKLPPSPQK